VAAAVLAGAALGSDRAALVTLGLGAGVLAATAVVLFAPERLAPALLIAFVALVPLRLEKHFAYQVHVGGWPGLRLSVADLCLLPLAALAVYGGLLGRVKNAVPKVVLALYGLLLVQYGLSALGASHRDLSAFELTAAVHSLVIVSTVAALFRRRALPWVLAAVAVAVGVHTSFAIVQVVTGRPVGLSWLSGSADVVHESLETGAVRLRPIGLFSHPIVFADFLMLSLPILAAGAFAARRRAARASLVAILLFGTVGLVLTLSRGAWISSAFAFVILLVLAFRRRLLGRRAFRTVAAGLLVLAAVLAPFAPTIWERFAVSQKGNLEVRFELNEIALSMIRAHPLAGVGLNNFIEVMRGYDKRDVSRYFPATVHNLYLLEAAEAGLPALVLFAGVLAAVFVTGAAGLKRVADPELAWLAAAALAGLAGFALSQVADFSHRLEPLRSILWTYVGLLFGAVASPPERAGAPS
jgi:O-antigen ligase